MYYYLFNQSEYDDINFVCIYHKDKIKKRDLQLLGYFDPIAQVRDKRLVKANEFISLKELAKDEIESNEESIRRIKNDLFSINISSSDYKNRLKEQKEWEKDMIGATGVSMGTDVPLDSYDKYKLHMEMLRGEYKEEIKKKRRYINKIKKLIERYK